MTPGGSGRAVAVVLDPGADLVDSLGQIEEWLLSAEVDSPDDDIDIRAGVRAAGSTSVALRQAARTAPDLYTADGRVELAPLTLISGDLGVVVAAVRGALLALPHEQPPPGTLRTLDLLHRCALRSPSEDGALLAATAATGTGAIRLNPAQYRAYQRFVRTVLVDPLDRFVALPPSCCGNDTYLDTQTGPEVGL